MGVLSRQLMMKFARMGIDVERVSVIAHNRRGKLKFEFALMFVFDCIDRSS